MIALHHIACTWNPELPDARGASLRRRAECHLGLRLNGLRHVSVYAVRAALDAAQRHLDVPMPDPRRWLRSQPAPAP